MNKFRDETDSLGTSLLLKDRKRILKMGTTHLKETIGRWKMMERNVRICEKPRLKAMLKKRDSIISKGGNFQSTQENPGIKPITIVETRTFRRTPRMLLWKKVNPGKKSETADNKMQNLFTENTRKDTGKAESLKSSFVDPNGAMEVCI